MTFVGHESTTNEFVDHKSGFCDPQTDLCLTCENQNASCVSARLSKAGKQTIAARRPLASKSTRRMPASRKAVKNLAAVGLGISVISKRSQPVFGLFDLKPK